MGRKAIVVGAGVVGLTTAIRLLEDGWKVKIIADQFSPNTLSDGTLAFWEPFFVEPMEKVVDWSIESLKVFNELMKTDPSAGIRPCSGWEFSEKSQFDVPGWLELVKWRYAEPSELPKGMNSGVYFDTIVAESPLFMPWLMRRVVELKGITEKRKITNLTDLLTDPFHPNLVANCTGLGAKELENDDQVEPIRGQVVRVKAPHVKNFYVGSIGGEVTYILPRSDIVICGGSAMRGNWDASVDPNETKAILQRCERFVPGISQCPIEGVWAGLRPGRSSIRLSAKFMKGGGKSVLLIHNYGHGGAGVTLAWGCAREVQHLARLHSVKGAPLRSKL